MASVAILILNYNGRDYLLKFLPSIVKNSPDCEVIVADNGSHDDSISVLENSFSDVRVIKLDKNYGYAEGYNRSIRLIDHDYVALVNSDVEVSPKWTESLIARLDSDHNVAAVQPKILSYTERNRFEYAGAAGGFIDEYGYPFCRGRIFGTIEEDNGQYDTPTEIFWASGACFMIRRSVFQEAGGFDEDFFAHMEEIDLCWRLHNCGHKIIFIGASTVYHLGGGTLSYQNPRKNYLNFRNSWAVLIKNVPERLPLKIILGRWWMDVMSIAFFLLQFQPLSSLAVIKAHWYILHNHKKIKRRRTGKTSDSQIIPSMSPQKISLVWQYFIKGKRKYSDLIPD